MATAPNIENYYVGKGILYFKKDGDSTWRDLGNVPEFEFTPELEELEHRSSRTGVRTVDRTIVLEKKGSVRIVAEEWDMENVALAFLGEVSANSDGDDVIDIFSTNAVSGQLKFVGQNEVGPRLEIILLRVDFIPGSAINPISDEWGTLELTGKVASVNGAFGTIRKLGEEGEDTDT